MVITPYIDVVKRGELIGFVAQLSSGLGGVLAGRKLSGSMALPITIIRIFGTFHMVFTNLIMTTRVNKSTNRPMMSSMAVGRYRSADVTNPIGGYQEPSTTTAPIFYHIDGHYVKPNKVAFKYHDFFLNGDPNAHVKMFNFVIKANV
jgi:hypothetical protein